MGYGYSVELKKRVLAYLEAGHGGKAEAAKVFKVDRKSVYNWLAESKECGGVSAPRRGARKRKLEKSELLEYIGSHPDAYLREIARHFGVAQSSLFAACQRWGITRKKSLILQRKRREGAPGVSGETRSHPPRKAPLPRRKRH